MMNRQDKNEVNDTLESDNFARLQMHFLALPQMFVEIQEVPGKIPAEF